MAYKAVFKRHELKYILTKDQKACILEQIQPFMSLDQYGRTTIRNIYFDTENYRLIRRSIEKPDYKEKLRVRSYANKKAEEKVFVELKKKYEKVVYKRRLSMSEDTAMKWLTGESSYECDSQIAREITYFLQYYETLHPVLFLSYEREAYYCKDGTDFRVTFDENVLCRQKRITFQSDMGGIPVLEEEKVLMEIKCSGGMPNDQFGGPGGRPGGDHGGRPGGQGGQGGFGGMEGASDGSIVISGGILSINASGDGIDANGILEITGGSVTVCGPTQGDTATLDYDVSGIITGGTFIGTGARNMVQTFSESKQGVIAVSVGNQEAGTLITLTDSSGNVIISHKSEQPFAIVILSSPEIKKGDTYKITVGENSGEFEAE